MLATSCVEVSVSGWLKELICNGSRYERKRKEVNTKCGNKQISTVGHWGSFHQRPLRDHVKHAHRVKKLEY